MSEEKKLASAISEAEKLFGLKVLSAQALAREEPDSIINSFLTTADGRQFFLKEVAGHSFREGFDEIYKHLSNAKTKSFQFLLPISHAAGKFLFKAADSDFLLLPKHEFSFFQPNKMEFPRLLSILNEMHASIAPFNFPQQSFRTFESWIRRALDNIAEKYGNNIPLIPQFQKYMSEDFPALKLAEGNIHWDIHERNLGFDGKGSLLILDLDLVQKGAIACDITRAACMYAKENGNSFHLSPEVVRAATQALKKNSSAISEKDVRFFIARTPLGPLQSPHYFRSREDSLAFLKSLEDFVEQVGGN